MADNPAFGKALRAARRRWEEAHDPDTLTDREIGERVAQALGRDRPYSSQAVNLWFDGREPQSWDIVHALARVLGAEPAELFQVPPLPRATAAPTLGRTAAALTERSDVGREGQRRRRRANGDR